MPIEPRPLAVPASAPAHDLIQANDLAQFLGFVWRRKWLLMLALASCVGLGVLFLWLWPATYESKAQLLVLKKEPRSLAGGNAGMPYLQDDLSTHETLLTSPWFIGQAIEKHHLASLPSLAEQKNPVKAVVRGTTVTRQEDKATMLERTPSSILNLSLRGPVEEDCQVILKAVIDQYEGFLRETSRKLNEEALTLITRRADELEKELRRKEEEHKEFRRKTPLLWNHKDGANSYQDQLALIEAQQSALKVRRTEVQTQLRAIEQNIAQGQDRKAIFGLLPESLKQQANTAMEEKLYPLLMQEKSLLQDFGPGHPQVQEIRDRIKFTRDFYAPTSAASVRARQNVDKDHFVQLDDPVDSYVRSLKEELAGLDNSQQALAKEFETLRDKTKLLADYDFQDQQFSDETARLQDFHRTMMGQLHGVDISRDLVGYSMSVLAPPEEAKQVAPVPLLVLAVAVVTGVLLGLLWGYLADNWDHGIHSADEIRRDLGLPVVGVVPLLSPDGNRRLRRGARPGYESDDPLLWAHQQPASIEAEAFRSVRTALYFCTRGKPQKVIQVTSPAIGDGKTTLAANLAVSIAQSGRRVLLIDADLRRPRIHRLFGVSNEKGLSSVLAGEISIRGAVQSGGMARLLILPSGPIPSNPSDMITSSHFHEMLEKLRDHFDFILVDTPALLSVTDPRVVAAQADGVLLAVSMTKNARREIERAKEVLDDLDSHLLGIVVNASHEKTEFGKYPYTLEVNPPPKGKQETEHSSSRKRQPSWVASRN